MWNHAYLEHNSGDVRPMSHLEFYCLILLHDILAVCNCARRTLQICRINKNWPISVHRILATVMHIIEHCYVLKRSCATVQDLCDTPCYATKLCDKIASVTLVLVGSWFLLLQCSHLSSICRPFISIWKTFCSQSPSLTLFLTTRSYFYYHWRILQRF